MVEFVEVFRALFSNLGFSHYRPTFIDFHRSINALETRFGERQWIYETMSKCYLCQTTYSKLSWVEDN